ncbi:LLM class flavin-dependent oxidoreductase [Candidatus Poriferisodalis sp.]|uniref:LLM class flavin-dependent oxidoreductase n=1 Tax=Candidatus Poriferisodalis sp. TaxID=3101277 RepID=UPI003B01951F
MSVNEQSTSKPVLGLLLGFEDSMADFVELARQGEAAGMGSMYTVEAGRSAFVSAAAVIAATERVTVGTYIANAYAREPWLTGIAARDLDELSGGRFTLGIGTGNPHFNDWYMGADSSRPLAKMREYIEIVRSVVAGRAGEPVRYDGDHHRIRWRATWEPTRPSIPVYLSASGPKMVQLAGEVSDGVGVGVMASVGFMSDIVRPAARSVAAEAGRDPDSLGFLMGSFLSVNADEELARKVTQATICGLFHPVPHPYYDSQLRQLGFDEFADAAARLVPQGQMRQAMELVPDEVVDTMTITGTPAQCAARIADYTGLSDEIILYRLPQRNDPPGLAGYESLFEVVSLACA